MVRSVTDGFEEFLRRLTPTAAQRQAAGRHREGVESALKSKLGLYRFFETGSFSHGTGIRNYSDVDALASIKGERPGSSDTGLRWVREALEQKYPYTTVKVRRPAVVIEFAGGDETWEVIPGFLTGRGGTTSVYDIPGPRGGWIDTAPDAHLAYANESNLQPRRGCAKSLARLLKAWKYYRNVPISSFYLEMRAAQHVRAQQTYVHLFDLCELLEDLHGHQLAAMNDPKGLTGRFHPCSSDANKRDALSKLDTAATRARKALNAHLDDDPDDAFYYLDLLFGGKFPPR